jgi:S-layer protein
LDIASIGNGSSTASVVTFEYGGDTYVLVDNSAAKTLTSDDAVIKLVGVDHTTLDPTNIAL